MDYIIVSLLNVLAVPLFVRAVFNLEFCYKRIRVVSVVGILVFALLVALYVRGLDTLCFQSLGILITMVFLKEKTVKNFLVVVVSVLIYSILEGLIRLIIPFKASFFSNIFVVISLTVFCWINNRKNRYIDSNFLTKTQLTLFSVFLLATGSLAIYDAEKFFVGKNIVMKISLFFIFLFTIIVFLAASFQWMFQRNLIEYKNRIMIDNFQKQKKYYQKQLESNREIRKIKHDMNNHLFVLHRYLEENKFDKANKYLMSLINECEKVKVSKYTDNDLLNIILEDLFREKKN